MKHYARDELPNHGWMTYRKTTLTAMFWAHGPCVVHTIDGAAVELGEDWDGFIALDEDGHPYPIDAVMQASSYELADSTPD